MTTDESSDKKSSLCFNNVYLQVMHKYSNLLLMLALAMLSYWFVGLESKQERGAEARVIIDKKVTALEVGQSEIMRGLQDIKVELKELNMKIYNLNKIITP